VPVDLHRDPFPAGAFSYPNVRLAGVVAQQIGQADITDETDVQWRLRAGDGLAGRPGYLRRRSHVFTPHRRRSQVFMAHRRGSHGLLLLRHRRDLLQAGSRRQRFVSTSDGKVRFIRRLTVRKPMAS
jgi:hypothetical protein